MKQADAALSPSPAAAHRAISLVFCMSGIDTGVWGSQIPRLKAWLVLSDAALAGVVLAFAVGAILTMPLAGALATRIGGAGAVRIAGIATAVALAALGAIGAYPWLLTASLLTGVAIGGLDVAMNTQATVIERAAGRPILSGIHGWFSLGGLGGAALGGALIGAGWSFAAIVWLSALASLAAIVPACRWLAVAEAAPAAGPAFALPSRAVLAIGLLCLFAFLIEGAIFDWMGVYMHETAGASLGFASAAFAGFSLAMAVLRFAGDGLVRRAGPLLTLRMGAVLVALGIALACAVPRPVAIVAGLTLTGAGQANLVPLLFGAAGKVPGVPAGVGVGMAATMGYGAFLLGPPAIGFLGDLVGLRLALLVLVACALAIAAGAGTVSGSPRRSR